MIYFNYSKNSFMKKQDLYEQLINRFRRAISRLKELEDESDELKKASYDTEDQIKIKKKRQEIEQLDTD